MRPAPDFDIEPDIDRAPRMYCDECRRKTPYRYDQFDMPVCLECQEEEECHE